MIRPAVLVLSIALVIGGAAAAQAETHFARAQSLIAAGNLRAGKIELQNAIQENAKDGAAQYALAKLDLALGEPHAAAQEARDAKANGYKPGKSLSLLLETYLSEGRPGQLLKDFPKAKGSPDIAARIAIGRGQAYMALGQPNQAAIEFASAERLAPKSVGPLLAAADLAFSQHDLAGAKRNIKAALALHPGSNQALIHEGQLLLFTGKPQEALTVLGPLVRRAPEQIVARLLYVRALMANGQDTAAKAKLKDILAIVPGSAEGLYLEVTLEMQAQNYKGALQTLQKLSPVMTRLPGAYFLQALVMAHLGEIKQAQESASRYVGHVPHDPRGIRLLADLDLRSGDAKGALNALRELSPAEQRNPATIELLGRIHGLGGNLRAAENNFEELVKLAPKAAGPRVQLGTVQLGLGNPAEAIVEFQQALDLKPDDAVTRRRLILTTIDVGRFNLARENLAVLEKQQGHTAANGNLEGLLKLAEVDLAGARSEFSAVVQKHPKYVPAVMNLARVTALQGHVNQAKTLIAGVLSRDPANPSALPALTRLLLAENKPTDAAKLLMQAHQAAPANASVVANLALLDIKIKKPKKALALINGSSMLRQRYPAQLMGIEAEAELALGEPKKARSSLENLLQVAPGDVGALLFLTRILVQQKDYTGATAALKAGLEADSGSYPLMQALVGVKFAEGGLAGGLKEAAQLASNPAHLPAARALAGDLDVSTKHMHAATVAYAAALEADPSSLALMLRYATALQAAGQRDKAGTVLRQYLQRHPKAVPVLLTLAGLDISTGHLDAAAERLKVVLAEDANNIAALNNLAWIDQKEGRSEAQNLAKRAYFLNSNGHTADTLGWILVQEHSDAAAIPLLRQAHEALPKSATITYHLAAALEAAGDTKTASELLHPIVSGKADFADKEAARTLLAKISNKP